MENDKSSSYKEEDLLVKFSTHHTEEKDACKPTAHGVENEKVLHCSFQPRKFSASKP